MICPSPPTRAICAFSSLYPNRSAVSVFFCPSNATLQISARSSFPSESFARPLRRVTTHVPQGHTALQWTPQAYEQLLLATTGGALPDFTLRGILRPFNGICNDLRFQVFPVSSKPTVICFICGDILIGTTPKYFFDQNMSPTPVLSSGAGSRTLLPWASHILGGFRFRCGVVFQKKCLHTGFGLGFGSGQIIPVPLLCLASQTHCPPTSCPLACLILSCPLFLCKIHKGSLAPPQAVWPKLPPPKVAPCPPPPPKAVWPKLPLAKWLLGLVG